MKPEDEQHPGQSTKGQITQISMITNNEWEVTDSVTAWNFYQEQYCKGYNKPVWTGCHFEIFIRTFMIYTST